MTVAHVSDALEAVPWRTIVRHRSRAVPGHSAIRHGVGFGVHHIFFVRLWREEQTEVLGAAGVLSMRRLAALSRPRARIDLELPPHGGQGRGGQAVGRLRRRPRARRDRRRQRGGRRPAADIELRARGRAGGEGEGGDRGVHAGAVDDAARPAMAPANSSRRSCRGFGCRRTKAAPAISSKGGADAAADRNGSSSDRVGDRRWSDIAGSVPEHDGGDKSFVAAHR
jgi:hypothetical protein